MAERMRTRGAMAFSGRTIFTGDQMSHSPDFPFGCAETWEDAQPAIPDALLTHVCNKSDGHSGQHACKCETQMSTRENVASRAKATMIVHGCVQELPEDPQETK